MSLPSGGLTSDSLPDKEPYDFRGDHPLTNLLPLLESVRQRGFFLEVSELPLTCVDLETVGNLLIVDPERSYTLEEIRYIQKLVFLGKLNLMIFADWFDLRILREVSVRSPIHPNNLYSLNKILSPFGIRLGYDSLSGTADFFGNHTQFLSGTFIAEFPAANYLYFADLKSDYDIMYGTKSVFAAKKHRLGVFGLFQTFAGTKRIGSIGLFCDSSCLEIGPGNCLGLLHEMLDFFASPASPKYLPGLLKTDYFKQKSLSTENEAYFEAASLRANLPTPNCKNFYSGDFDLLPTSSPVPAAESGQPVPSSWGHLQSLGGNFVLAVALFGIFLCILQRKRERRRISREFSEVRIPKYSVIYI
jgi:hypothetical protein